MWGPTGLASARGLPLHEPAVTGTSSPAQRGCGEHRGVLEGSEDSQSSRSREGCWALRKF